MFESIANFFKKLMKSEAKETTHSKDTAKERLHLVLMQDRANVSADFLELMKQEIIEVIKKYIEVEESAIDVRLTNEIAEDGTKGAPSLYANIPILNIKNNIKKEESEEETKEEDKKENKKVEENKEVKDEKQEETKQEEAKQEEAKQEEIKQEENIKEAEKVKEKSESINETKKAQTKKNTQSKKNTTKKVSKKASN